MNWGFTVKDQKIGTQKNLLNNSKNKQNASKICKLNGKQCRKYANQMANSTGPDQTAPLEQSSLGLLCLLQPNRPNA